MQAQKQNLSQIRICLIGILNPPKYEDRVVVGVGGLLASSIQPIQASRYRACESGVARAVETTVNSALNDHMQASGMGAEAGATEFTESVSKSLVNTTLKGCTIEKTEVFKERVFVLVTYDANKAAEEAKAAARLIAKESEEALYEFKARQAFDALDSAIIGWGPALVLPVLSNFLQ